MSDEVAGGPGPRKNLGVPVHRLRDTRDTEINILGAQILRWPVGWTVASPAFGVTMANPAPLINAAVLRAREGRFTFKGLFE